jgi:DNA-binding Xre family transcriptional regulator
MSRDNTLDDKIILKHNTVRRDMLDGMIQIAIREMAERRGITTAYQLMKAAGVQPAVAAKWWTNELDKIGIGTLDKLCTVFECTPNDILIFKPERKKGRQLDGA